MSQERGPRAIKSRQYRSNYGYLPTSASGSNFGAPYVSKTTLPSSSFNRSSTFSTFPSANLLHSAPTVASSSHTASVLSHDISHPSPKTHRLSLQPRTVTPTRIPTPNSNISSTIKCRAVSSPAATSYSKETVQPVAHRLLGPIPPDQFQHSMLTKSRTMNVLSSFASPFTRSTQNLASSRASLSNLSAYNGNFNKKSSLPLPIFTTNIRQISTSMPTAYWLGRFQALHDRFRAGNLESDFLSPSVLVQSPGKSDELLAKKVFIHLETLCTNNEARKNLKAFQQAYARKMGCEALLPIGGTMVDSPGLMAKAGRLFSGGRKSGFGARVLGKKNSIGMGLDNTTPAT